MTEFDPKVCFAESAVSMLATVTPTGSPHVVPVVFAVADDMIYTAVDSKKKSTHRLRRLANIENNPQVCVLVEHYSDDWTQLWWVRADGVAEIHYRGEEMAKAYSNLRSKYAQYQRISLEGPVVTIAVRRWASWHA
jgi:PPOX class probable F420-dependent enzyme